jgi:disulfide bond formation protein DsbB
MIQAPLDRVKWPFAALVASGVMLAAAHGFERFLLLAPCQLCYLQRQVYWAAAAVALVAISLKWRGASSKLLLTLNLILGGVFLFGAGVAGYHTLVEWGALPAPPCAATGAVRIEGDLLDQLSKPIAVPSCDEAKWWFPTRSFGLSMAGWNTLVSLALAGLSVYSARRRVRTDTANETANLHDALYTADSSPTRG